MSTEPTIKIQKRERPRLDRKEMQRRRLQARDIGEAIQLGAHALVVLVQQRCETARSFCSPKPEVAELDPMFDELSGASLDLALDALEVVNKALEDIGDADNCTDHVSELTCDVANPSLRAMRLVLSGRSLSAYGCDDEEDAKSSEPSPPAAGTSPIGDGEREPTRCPECGSTEHGAAHCDNGG